MDDIHDSATQPGDSPENPQEESRAWILTPEESRVLGCLMEKARTTPEYYPLTMNALVAACNQKTSRDPVVDYNEAQVDEAVAGLRSHGLALRVTMAGSRVPKFQHCMERAFPDLNDRGMALIAVLLLRGRQTLGELRSRTERLFHFPSLDAVQNTLDDLVCFPPRQLVRELPPGGVHHVPTFVQLLSGDPGADSPEPGRHHETAAAPAADWRDKMEEELAALRAEVESLRRELDSFRSQF
jgi:hypothetical protein